VTIREQRPRKTRNRVSWRKHSCATYGVEVVRKYGIREKEKWKVEEQSR